MYCAFENAPLTIRFVVEAVPPIAMLFETVEVPEPNAEKRLLKSPLPVTFNPLLENSPAVDSPPENVEVAVVEVALNVDAEINPPATKFFETSRRPANVEVAVVEVALIAATWGVEVEVRFPDASNPASMLAAPVMEAPVTVSAPFETESPVPVRSVT